MKLTDNAKIEVEINTNENNIDSVSNYALQETLTEITDAEIDVVKTVWDKLKKIVIAFLAHVKVVATSSVLGHVKVKSGNGLNNVDGTISIAKATTSEYGATQLANNTTTSSSGEYALDAHQGKVLADSIATKAPKSHASTTTEYGLGNEGNYGHVKVSDTYKSKLPEGAAEDGVAASQNALYNSYNELNDNLTNINNQLLKVEMKYIEVEVTAGVRKDVTLEWDTPLDKRVAFFISTTAASKDTTRISYCKLALSNMLIVTSEIDQVVLLRIVCLHV